MGESPCAIPLAGPPLVGEPAWAAEPWLPFVVKTDRDGNRAFPHGVTAIRDAVVRPASVKMAIRDHKTRSPQGRPGLGPRW